MGNSIILIFHAFTGGLIPHAKIGKEERGEDTPTLPGGLTENHSASRQVIPSLPGKCVHLVFEYIPGEDLHTIARHHHHHHQNWLPEEDVRLVIKPLLDAIEYVHKEGYIHRDIKIENVMVREPKTDDDDDWSVYLIDFGLSIRKEDAKAGDTAGTLDYLSPEMILATSYDEKIDIWALGVMMVELLCGNPPFSEDIVRDLARASRTGDSATVYYNIGRISILRVWDGPSLTTAEISF